MIKCNAAVFQNVINQPINWGIYWSVNFSDKVVNQSINQSFEILNYNYEKDFMPSNIFGANPFGFCFGEEVVMIPSFFLVFLQLVAYVHKLYRRWFALPQMLLRVCDMAQPKPERNASGTVDMAASAEQFVVSTVINNSVPIDGSPPSGNPVREMVSEPTFFSPDSRSLCELLADACYVSFFQDDSPAEDVHVAAFPLGDRDAAHVQPEADAGLQVAGHVRAQSAAAAGHGRRVVEIAGHWARHQIVGLSGARKRWHSDSKTHKLKPKTFFL